MEKFKNDFNGFVHILNDNSIYKVFGDWLNACNFNLKFSLYNNYTSRLVKEDSKIGMQFVIEFQMDYKMKNIDINYVIDTIKDVIPFEVVESTILTFNEERKRPWYMKLDKYVYNNSVEFFIPFSL